MLLPLSWLNHIVPRLRFELCLKKNYLLLFHKLFPNIHFRWYGYLRAVFLSMLVFLIIQNHLSVLYYFSKTLVGLNIGLYWRFMFSKIRTYHKKRPIRFSLSVWLSLCLYPCLCLCLCLRICLCLSLSLSLSLCSWLWLY